MYSVIGYFLRHQAEVESYQRDLLRRGVEVRRENEARFDPILILSPLHAIHRSYTSEVLWRERRST